MKKALVIGGSGFIGSHVADTLKARGYEVTIFDRAESRYLQPEQRMVVGDILDQEAVNEVVKGHEFVLNMAGIAGLNDAKDQPVNAAQVNILGNLHVLEAIREDPPERFILASTYYVYSKSGSIYRVTKQSCELFLEEYARLYGIPFTIVRYGSVYGPRAGGANAIYRFIREAIESGSITRKGSADDVREYVHVLDAAEATCTILEQKEMRDKYVILAGQDKLKIRELFTMINEMMDGKLSITFAPAELNDHVHYSITPYSFQPQKAVRYYPSYHHDLGQGMLEMMYEIEHEYLSQREAGATSK